MNNQVIGKVLKEIGLLPQLYKPFLACDDKVVISLPWKKYCQAISHPLFTYKSDFYAVFLRHSTSKHNCTPCLNSHSQNQLCLPHLLEKDAPDFILNMLENKQFYLYTEGNLVSLIRICGYFLLHPDILHTFLLNLLSRYFADWKAESCLFKGFIGMDIWKVLFIMHKVLVILTFLAS